MVERTHAEPVAFHPFYLVWYSDSMSLMNSFLCFDCQ